MEILSTTALGNGVKATVRQIPAGFIPEVVAPDTYTGQHIIHSMGRKTYKTEAGAMKAAVKFAQESFAHIIDPEAYWA
jgi:hypothetical protein